MERENKICGNPVWKWNMERLAERFSGMDPEECKTVLDKIQDMSKQIGRSIDLNIEAEKRKTRTAVRRPVRGALLPGRFPLRGI